MWSELNWCTICQGSAVAGSGGCSDEPLVP
jgi:hypothetical protein